MQVEQASLLQTFPQHVAPRDMAASLSLPIHVISICMRKNMSEEMKTLELSRTFMGHAARTDVLFFS